MIVRLVFYIFNRSPIQWYLNKHGFISCWLHVQSIRYMNMVQMDWNHQLVIRCFLACCWSWFQQSLSIIYQMASAGTNGSGSFSYSLDKAELSIFHVSFLDFYGLYHGIHHQEKKTPFGRMFFVHWTNKSKVKSYIIQHVYLHLP